MAVEAGIEKKQNKKKKERRKEGIKKDEKEW